MMAHVTILWSTKVPTTQSKRARSKAYGAPSELGCNGGDGGMTVIARRVGVEEENEPVKEVQVQTGLRASLDPWGRRDGSGLEGTRGSP
jgi:hypothetical protein